MTKWSKAFLILAFGFSNVNSFAFQQGFGKALSPIAQETRVQFTGDVFASNQKESQTMSTTTLFSARSSETPQEFDTEAVLKYAVAGVTELSLFAATFRVLDIVLEQNSLTNSVPAAAIGFLFYACSLKSRVFNPLNNQRPNASEEKSTGFRDRVMPSWTPPGVVFPIMWLLIIGPIRAYSSTLIVEANNGLFCTPETLAFIFHLTVGDIWNTINNTEKRYGAAVVGVLGVLSSALFAASQYYEVLPFAGKLLGATCIWLTIASALITDTWRLNPDADGKRDPLFPTKAVGEESITQFDWFKTNESS